MTKTTQPTPPEYPEFEALKRGALAVGKFLLAVVVGLVVLAVEAPFGIPTKATKRKLAEADAKRKAARDG